VSLLERWSDAVRRELGVAVELRHELHRSPRVSGDEADTAAAVVAALGTGPGRVVAGTGRLVRVTGEPDRSGAVAVRTELDGLPVLEQTTAEWASYNGVMHACGHDVHMAALVALARAVDDSPSAPPLLAVLQPREEKAPSGASDIVASGLLTACRGVVGAHVQPLLGPGTVACTPGVVNASSDEFTITVTGNGGHAAYPHTVADPVLAVAHVVTGLESVPRRFVEPTATAVVTATRLAAGSSTNVVPDAAVVEGTVRAMREEDRRRLLDGVTATARDVAAAYGCAATTSIAEGEPPLVNEAGLTASTAIRLRDLGFTVDAELRSAGADDFAHYSEHLPALMMFVGVAGGGRLHTSTFVPPDEAVRDVAYAMLAGFCAAAAPGAQEVR
jgi:amidohydrolase